ncbi:MAG TPA: hypothetical protein VFI46_10345 [Jiangellaceae bacterium]|nr:hypothetical protein [Jiangellaceae bacterium]
MTCYPVEANYGHWWLVGPSWRVLHAVVGDALQAETLHDAIDDGTAVTRTTRCFRSLRVEFPGPLTRLGAPRCRDCCRVLGIAPGDGTPANEAALARRVRT